MNRPAVSPIPEAGIALSERPVLASALLQPGAERSGLSRYSDMTWDLSSALVRENVRRCHITIHFSTIDDYQSRELLREFLYARLNQDIPGIRRRLPPGNIRQLFNQTRRFLDFVRVRQNHCDLRQVDQPLLDAYLQHLKKDPQRSATQVAHLLQAVIDLHHYRDHLPSGGITMAPWRGRTAYEVAGARSSIGENRTPRIPEAIIEPLLRWSLKYVTVFAPDIFAARAELNALESHYLTLRMADAQRPYGAIRAAQRQRVADWLAERQDAGRGVPVWTTAHNGVYRRDHRTGEQVPPINRHLIRLHAGIRPTASFDRLGVGTLVQRALEANGVEVGGFDTPLAIDPDTGSPWRPRFDAKMLITEELMLQTACYIVCAYLTGMRDCEIQAMQTGCLRIERSADGLIDRYRVHSTAYKGRSHIGEPENWITISPVAQAIAVMEQLTNQIRQQRGGNSLWRVLHNRTDGKEYVSAEIVRNLNVFRNHLNAQFGQPSAPVVPPGPEGVPMRLTTRQFRRTVAWYIGNRPFGTVAGKIQYKHASIAAFEGYAGSSRSGFRREVERERALGQLDDILEYFEGRRTGETLSGPASKRINRELDEAVTRLGPLPGVLADAARVRTMLAHLAKTLFVGVLNDCFFDPTTALCLAGRSDHEGNTPQFALCQPDRCPNACMTERHRPHWLSSIAEAEDLLRTKKLSPLQRRALRDEITRQRRLIGEEPSGNLS